MKLSLAALLVATMLASCSSGGGGSNQEQAPNDAGSPVTPLVALPETPTTTPPTDVTSQLGVLADLIGGVGIAYGFAGTETVFSLGTEYTVDDYLLTDAGNGLLFADAATFTRLSPGSETLRGRNMFLACGFNDSLNIFLCIADAGGASESFFTFGRLSNGAAQGSFEFCNGASTEACATGVQLSPDGIAAIIVASPQAASSIASKAKSEEIDLLPYFQYLKQGSPEVYIVANLTGQSGDALIDAAKSLKEALIKE